METAILGGLVKEVIMSLGGFTYNDVARMLGAKGEITKLAESLRTVTLELRDADQTIAHSEATDERLKKLTEIAYEAESIIDRFKIKMGMQKEWSGSSLCRCCREVNTRCDVVKRIEKLNKRLEDLRSRELSQVLQALAAARQQSGSSSSMIGPCHEEPNMSGSVISNDCNDHMRRLRRDSDSGGNQSLFAIVGAPGVGKTSLARKIYQEMRGEFEQRMWVHISSVNGSMNIWWDEDMDREASSSPPEQQKEMIRQYLTGSNLLLVIDNVRDKDGWDYLGELGEGFLCRGVRVILTTSHRDVTRMIGVNRWSGCHHVRALDDEDGWLLLVRTTQLKEHEAVGNFQDAGKRIVRKCSGLPLALKAVGSRLRHQDQLGQWMTELSTDFIIMHREIRWSIDASYMELGYRLKLCFLFCSLYPEGHVIKQREVVQQWIAEGFFESEAREGQRQGTCPLMDAEEEARRCYMELVNRSLLLPTTISNGCATTATMPNLLRSYALYRSQDENYVGNPRNIGHVFKVWRLYAANGDMIRDIPGDITSLRTLLVLGSSTSRGDSNTAIPSPSVMNIICRKFSGLRVLDLRDAEVDDVSSNLGRLLQLRYLNLSNTGIAKLPREVKNLVMLRFLILNNCCRLQSLPKGVGHLNNLRSLEISGTPMLQDIQFRLLNLKELNCFRGFLPVSSSASATSRSIRSAGWTFMEMSRLSKLTSLQILKLGNGTMSSQEAAQLRLHEMSGLKDLELCCASASATATTRSVVHGQLAVGDAETETETETETEVETETKIETETERIYGIFAKLRPPQHLTTLKLVDLYSSQLPDWVSSSHLTLLERLTLEGCFQCQQLPSLGEMTHLKFLEITGCNALSEIGDELRGAPIYSVAFPRLEQLIMGKMENLQAWSGLLPRDKPLLCSFQLSDCRRLGALPPWLTHCMALTSLKIQGADNLPEIRGLPELKELQVENCPSLRRISKLNRLEDLDITSCSALDTVEGIPLMRSLRLHQDKNAMELPPWLEKQNLSFRLLRRLEIVGAEGLLDRCSSDFWPRIHDIADIVYAKLDDGSIYFSYTRSTGRLHKGPRWIQIQRANTHGAALERIALPTHETIGGGKASAWMWCAVSGLTTAFLIGSAVILWYTGTRSSTSAITLAD